MGQTYVFLLKDPFHPFGVTIAHGTKNRDRDSEPAFTKLSIFRFGELFHLDNVVTGLFVVG